MNTYCVGDAHWSHKALVQCLEKCNFNYEEDQLICLGDISDSWPDTPLVVEELLKIKNLILIEGNHDTWAREWLKFWARPDIWTMQWGQQTIDSYIAKPELMVAHRDFFDRAVKCYVDDKMRLFVHWGFKLGTDAKENDLRYLTWDRDLYDQRHNDLDISPYSEVFIGHTSTWNVSHLPFERNNVWFLDQGAWWEWVLTILNVETKEYWQSDKSKELYPGFHGR
jgi:serine/threonine protein phosphatase 1